MVTVVASRFAWAQDMERVPLPLLLNQVPKQEVQAVVAGDDILVRVADLRDAGLRIDGGRRQVVAGELYVSLNSLLPTFKYHFDLELLTLQIDAPAEYLGHTSIRFAPARPPNIEYARDFSAFFNYALNVSNGPDFTGFAELGATASGGLLYSGLLLNPGGKPVRGLSYAMVDYPPYMLRGVAGDAMVGVGGLGAILVMGGLHVGREFTLDPYFVHFPSLGMTGTVSTPSTVEIYNNGALVRRETVSPGTFDLSQMPISIGSGAVQVVVRDAFGGEHQIVMPYYAGSGLLEEGLSTFRVSGGFPRMSVGDVSFSYGALAFMGNIAYGLTPHLTLGARLEAQNHIQDAGITLSLAAPWGGELDAELAGSRMDGVSGAGALLAYSYLGRHISFGLLAHAYTEDYVNLNYSPDVPLTRFDGSLLIGVPVARFFSLVARYQVSEPEHSSTHHTAALTATVAPLPVLTLSVIASRTQTWQQDATYDVFASMTYVFDPFTTASLVHDQSTSSFTSLQAQRVLPVGEGFGYRGEVLVNNERQVYGDATLQYQTSFGRYTAYYQRTAAAVGAPAANVFMATAAGGIVYLDGLHFSRPVEDSYILLRVPGLAGVNGYIDNQRVGSTDSAGNLLIPRALPYYGNQVRIEDDGIPIDYALGELARTVAPAYRGGALVQFDARPARNYVGTLVWKDAAGPRPPAYGELRLLGPTAMGFSSPIGTAGEYFLQNVPVGTYRARIMFRGAACVFDLNIPPSVATINDLGASTCTPVVEH